MIKRLFITFYLLATIMVIAFPIITQAETPYVGDCLGQDVGSDCFEDLGEKELLKVDEVEDNEQPILSMKKNNESLAINMIKTIIALALILALIYLLIKFLSRRNTLFHQVKALENLGGISLGQSKSIQIVRIGEKVFMVGVGDNVELLQEIDDENTISDLVQQREQSDFNMKNLFPNMVKERANKTDAANDGSQQKFKKLFTNELEKLKENRSKVKNQQKKKED